MLEIVNEDGIDLVDHIFHPRHVRAFGGIMSCPLCGSVRTYFSASFHRWVCMFCRLIYDREESVPYYNVAEYLANLESEAQKLLSDIQEDL